MATERGCSRCLLVSSSSSDTLKEEEVRPVWTLHLKCIGCQTGGIGTVDPKLSEAVTQPRHIRSRIKTLILQNVAYGG